MQLDAMGLDNVQTRIFQPVKPNAPLMSEAAAFYVRLEGDRKDKVFARAAERNSSCVTDVLTVIERLPVPLDVIRTIQDECFMIDDDNRRLIAMMADTGMRLSEAVGLLVDDIKLDATPPHITLQKHPWRPLRTASSQRDTPLIGSALKAAERIEDQGNRFAFPRYCSEFKCNANSASAALNKWLKHRLPEGCVIHSLRHSLRDRLRVVGCPSDIIDAIGGWITAGVGHKYGKGHNLLVKQRWMKRLG